MNWFEWIHSKVAPICEKKEPDLNSEQRFQLSAQYIAANTCTPEVTFPSQLAFKTPEEQRFVIEEYRKIYPDMVLSEYVDATLAPYVPWTAKPAVWVWKKLSYGTDCMCCVSYRVIALLIISFLLGVCV